MTLSMASIEGTRLGLYIDGTFVAPRTGEYLPSYDPTDATAWYEFANAGVEDVDAAVTAATRAFRDPAWRRMTQSDRGRLLRRLADLVLDHAEGLAQIETRDNGKLIKEMRAQMRSLPDSYQYFAGMADKVLGETIPINRLDTLNFNRIEPLGVIAMITPWNSPLMLLTGTLAPCLAIGNTVVVKPSEHTTASALALGELIAEAGFPDGVYNVVSGSGAQAGDALTRHPGVAKYVFTGSTATGRRIAANAAEHLAPCSMELGGKSPHVVFADVDIEHAVNGVVSGVFAAAGQTCVAGSRCFVERSVYDRFVEALVERTRRVRVGHPMDEATDIGPLALADQLDKVKRYVASGVAEGARALAGGSPPAGADFSSGWYFSPTVMADAHNAMTFMRDEIFGPVVGVMPFSSEEEMIALANDTAYGLASGIWTRDISRAMRFAEQIDAGTVWINTYRASSYMSSNGGFKDSGYGMRGGFDVMREFSRKKNVIVDYSGTAHDPFVMKLK